LIEKGDVQITSELPYTDVNALKANPNVTINIIPTIQNLMPMFNTGKPPLDNKQVRQALSYAFPYQQVIDTALGGYAAPSYGFVPVGLWGHSEKVFQYTYDLEKAKQLLTQAGYPNGGFKLLLTYLSGDEAEKITSELYKTELAKLGIEVEIRSMPWDSQWEMAKSLNAADRQDIFVMYWWPDMPSPYSMLYSTFHSEEQPSFNLCYYKNPAFDKLIDDANELSGSDRATAEGMFIEAQNMLMDDAPAIAAFDRQSVYLTSSNLKGLNMNPVYTTVIFFYGMYLDK
jgi:peptide/nickel transport system substrate-binding protein